MRRACSICNSQRKKFLTHQRFYSLSNKNFSYDIVACKDCGFVYADNTPSQNVYNDYYKKMSKYEGRSRDGYVSPPLQNSHKRIYKIIEKFAPSRGLFILDIGCSTGNLLNNFKMNGYRNVFGIDPSPRCKEVAKRLYNIKIATTTLGNYHPKRKFDLILLSHVLEHFIDIEQGFKIIKKISKPKMLLYIEIPAAHKFREAVGEPFGQFSIEHVNFFSEISLINLMRSHGFEKVYLKTPKNKEDIYPPYPVITSLWRKTDIVKQPEHDRELIKYIFTYISLSERLNEKIQRKIDKIAKLGAPVILWGAGVHTLRLMAMTNLAKMNIKAIVDSNKNLLGNVVNGIKVQSPDSIKETTDSILISSYIYQREIADFIRRNIKSCPQIITLY